jgi:CHAD domain-containing protein
MTERADERVETAAGVAGKRDDEAKATAAAPPILELPAEDGPARPALGPAPGPIVPTDSLAIAGRKAMWLHVDRMLTREPGVGDPDRPDDLRKYRVAIRRLRAAVRMFGEAYPEREIRPLRRGLADLAELVGTIRDLDNRIGDLSRWAADRGEAAPAGVAALLATWTRDRERALAGLLARLETRRHQRLVTALVGFVDLAPPNPPRPRARVYTIHDRIASMLWAAYEDLRVYGPVIRWADLETIHAMRVAGKRFRDDLDFLADVLPPERAALTERLVALQDHLGALNDVAVTVAAVRAYLEHRGASPAELEQIGAYVTDKEREVALLRRTIWRPWRPIAGLPFARRLARLVVARRPAA